MLTVQHKETKVNLLENYKKNAPHIMKYMGSKREILGFVIEAINEVYDGERVCDLFGGTSILSGAIGHLVPMHSNDIQEYSAVLANTYLSNYDWAKEPNIIEDVINDAMAYVELVKRKYPELQFDYSSFLTIDKFKELERKQQSLIDKNFSKLDYYLFIKNYSGTYWSFNQCLWIDSIKKTADKYKDTVYYFPILSSLIHAMSYCAQSTGHYAQYRDVTNQSNKNDILNYRLREIEPYFRKKFNELQTKLVPTRTDHVVTSLDYVDCLDELESGSVVYADPPYAFVHYSRFYHALETLVKYDYPKVFFKGRYREDRHQSPFCQGSNVRSAFTTMFQKIRDKNFQLILSYSDTGMIGQDEVIDILNSTIGNNYEVKVKTIINHVHSTMGRSDNKDNEVKEFLIIAKYK